MLWLVLALMFIPSLVFAEPLRTVEDLQRAAQELDEIVAMSSQQELDEMLATSSESEIKTKALPIALRISEMYQKTGLTGEFVNSKRLFAKGLFISCFVSATDPENQEWWRENDCHRLKYLDGDSPSSLYIFAWAYAGAIDTGKRPRTLDEFSHVFAALNKAIEIHASDKEKPPIFSRMPFSADKASLVKGAFTLRMGFNPPLSDRHVRLNNLKDHLKQNNYKKAIEEFEKPLPPLTEIQKKSGLHFEFSEYDATEWYIKEHSVILTAQRKPFYNREKRNPSPIAKDFRWA